MCVQELDHNIDSASSERETTTGPNLSTASREMRPSWKRSRETDDEQTRAIPDRERLALLSGTTLETPAMDDVER
jgi:hypothetical protein